MSLPTDNIDYDELSEALADIETLTGDHFVEDDEPDVVKTESVEIGVGALESVTIGVSKDHVPAQTVDGAFAYLDEFVDGLEKHFKGKHSQRRHGGGKKRGGKKTGARRRREEKQEGKRQALKDAKKQKLTGPRDEKTGEVSWAKGGHAKGAAADKIFAIGKHDVTHGGTGLTGRAMEKLKKRVSIDGKKKTVAVDEIQAVAKGISSKTWAKTVKEGDKERKLETHEKNKLAREAVTAADTASAGLGVTKLGSISKAVDTIFGRSGETDKQLRGIMGGIEKSKSMEFNEGEKGAAFGARVAKTTGTVTVMGPIKTRDRHAKKMIVDEQGDPRKVTDVTRSTVVVDKARDIPAAMASFEKSLPSGAKIVSAKDRMNNPLPGGYRDIMLHIQHPNKSISEVQFNTKPMMKAKMGEGHKKYEESREITAKETLGTATPTEIKRRDKLEKESEAIYTKAWEESL